MDKKLAESEMVLVRTLTLWLRGEMMSRLKGVSPAPDLLHDMAQSNYEISCSALERVGILTSEGRYWRVKEPIDNNPTLPSQLTRTDLDHLLEGLACHSHYVNDLYLHQETVIPTEKVLHEVCQAMAVCGYMTATSAKTFEWSDDFGPWLVRHAAWDLDEFEAAPQDELDSALASISDKAREWLSGPVCRQHAQFVRCFFAQWIGGKWEEDLWRKIPNDDWDLNLASGLYAKLHRN